MDTKNQLLRFFISGHLSLSDYDYKFMANLLSMIEKNNRITSNQDALFDKLVKKYSRQLKRNNLTDENIRNLMWKCEVVPTSEEHTSAYLYIDNGMLKFRTPFNRVFIEYFTRHVRNKINRFSIYIGYTYPFEFDVDEKVYVGEFNTLNLKEAYLALHKFFKVRYCDILSPIINQLESDTNLIYEPTLKLVNGRLYLLAANEYVYEEATKIGFDLDINTFYKLGQLGISADRELLQDRPDLDFAISYAYEHDLTDIDTLLEYIQSIPDVEVAVHGRTVGANEVKNRIKEMGRNHEGNLGNFFYVYFPGTKLSDGVKSKKLIKITNSTPIEVR